MKIITTFFILFTLNLSFSQMSWEGVIVMGINNDSLLVNIQTEQFIITYTNNQSREIYTDTVLVTSDGMIPMCYLPSGTYTTYIKSQSFLDFEMEDIIVNGNRITFIDLELEEKELKQGKTIKKYKKPLVMSGC